MFHIGAQNPEFIGLAAAGNVRAGDQTDTAIFQTLDTANIDQFIQNCASGHIAAEFFDQFTKRRISSLNR